MVDIVHGHSSHHAKGLEANYNKKCHGKCWTNSEKLQIYRDKLILYGCGDFLNDYEGISGHDEFHDEFTLMYFPTVDAKSGKLVRMQAVPMLIEHMRLQRAPPDAATWLYATMKRECAKLGVQVEQRGKEAANSNIFTFFW
jgi:poly-gamma-glutamate synthesis protein (capsule biosynthesis protein)